MDPEPQLNLLLELEDDAARARRRESVLLSVSAHLVALVVLLVSPLLSESVRETLRIEEDNPRPREQLTYLALPPDDLVVQTKPKTNVLSDKDRRAQPDLKLPPLPRLAPPAEPTPPAEKKGEEELLAKAQEPSRLPPGNAGQRSPKSRAGQPTPPRLRLEDLSSQRPKLTLPTQPSPGHALEETVRKTARNRGGGPSLSDLDNLGSARPPGGFKPRGPGAVGNARILTDTLGVDFDPYLRRVVMDIRQNWYAVMPEIARLGKRGQVTLIFEILRDGEVPKLYLVSTSGSEPLDRAALAGISASAPFPPLPAEFSGPFVRIRVTFLYNAFYER